MTHKSRWHQLTDAGIHVAEKGKFMVMIVINRSTEAVKKTDPMCKSNQVEFYVGGVTCI